MPINDRLQHLLDRSHSSYAVLPHHEAFTAQEVAEASHVAGRALAKVVVVRDAAGADLMVVLPAAQHFDRRELHEVTGRTGFQLEHEDELARLFPDCEIGAMPPFGHLYGLPMRVDPCLLENELIYFQAGNHREVVRMRREDWEKLAQPFLTGHCVHKAAAGVGR